LTNGGLGRVVTLTVLLLWAVVAVWLVMGMFRPETGGLEKSLLTILCGVLRSARRRRSLRSRSTAAADNESIAEPMLPEPRDSAARSSPQRSRTQPPD
jgi:hypothetical protein